MIEPKDCTDNPYWLEQYENYYRSKCNCEEGLNMEDGEYYLREFVGQYIPAGWTEKIQTVMFVPYWDNASYNNFKNGKDLEFMHPILKLAIEDYFKQDILDK